MTKDEAMAILQSHQSIIITYVNETTDDGQVLTRRVHPLVLGTTKRGKLAIRAWQDFGGSHTSPLGWRIFLLKNIKEWTFKGELPLTPPTGYNQYGDDDLNVIYQVTYPLTDTVTTPTEGTPANEVGKQGGIIYPLVEWIKRWRNKNKKKE